MQEVKFKWTITYKNQIEDNFVYKLHITDNTSELGELVGILEDAKMTILGISNYNPKEMYINYHDR